jgi:hypothetical protein
MAILDRSTTDPAQTKRLAERGGVAPEPALPPSARRAVVAMCTGLALTIVATLVPIIDQASSDELARHLHDVYAGYNVDVPPTSAVLAYLVTIGALGIMAWLWMLWAVTKQKRWARPAATAIFVLASGLAVANLTVREYGQTILPTQVGLVGLLPCLAGLAAVTLLWRRERR